MICDERGIPYVAPLKILKKYHFGVKKVNLIFRLNCENFQLPTLYFLLIHQNQNIKKTKLAFQHC